MLQCYVLMCTRSVNAFMASPRSQRPGQGRRSPHPKAGTGAGDGYRDNHDELRKIILCICIQFAWLVTFENIRLRAHFV
jgi:hypothetical protein